MSADSPEKCAKTHLPKQTIVENLGRKKTSSPLGFAN
jgi:hypothetical protein